MPENNVNQNDNRKSVEPEIPVDNIVMRAGVESLPQNHEWWQLVGKYNEKDFNWYATGSLFTNKIDAEAQLNTWQFKVARLVKIILPA